MKKLKYIFIPIMGGVFIFFACKKKDFPSGSGGLSDLLIECDCDTIPPYSGGSPNGYYQTIEDSTLYFDPIFNPNNDNEIIFLFQDTYGYTGGIYKLNIQTNIKTAVYTSESISPGITWSSKDWIIFRKNSDGNLYKIKSNGDSITQLSFLGEYFSPNWNFDGTKFTSYNHYANVIMELNENGEVTDTLEGWNIVSDGNHPNYIVGFPQANRLAIMDIESKTIIREVITQLPDIFITAGWATNDKIIYVNSDGLFIYGINNGVKQKMRNSCNAYSYGGIARNSSSTKLVSNKLVQKLIIVNGEEVLHQDVLLVIMNTNGSNEQEIIIP